MSLLYKSTGSQVVMLKLFLSSDHITAATGKTVAIKISKNGGAFGDPNAGATNATEVSSGWYKVTLDATDTGTEGDLVVRGTATSCDDTERTFRVHLPANFGITSINGSGQVTFSNASIATVTTVTNQLTAAQIATGVWQDATAGDFTAANSIGKSIMNGVSLGTGLTIAAVSGAVGSVTGAVGSVTGAVGSVTGNVGGNVTGSVGSVVGAVGSVTGLTASDVGAIKAKTDLLVFTVAGQVDANIQYVNDVQVNGNGAGTPWGP